MLPLPDLGGDLNIISSQKTSGNFSHLPGCGTSFQGCSAANFQIAIRHLSATCLLPSRSEGMFSTASKKKSSPQEAGNMRENAGTRGKTGSLENAEPKSLWETDSRQAWDAKLCALQIEVGKSVTSVTSLIIRDLTRNTTRYTSVTSVTLLIHNNLHSSFGFWRLAFEVLSNCTRKIGNIGYTPDYQQLSWQHNRQHIGNTELHH